MPNGASPVTVLAGAAAAAAGGDGTAIVDKTVEAMRSVRGAGYWEHGWRAINDTLHFMQRRPASENPVAAAKLDVLIALEREFRPRTLDDLFDTFVLGEPWRHWHPNGADRKLLRNASRLARGVGRALTRRGADLSPYLDRAGVAGGANSVWPFMVGVAQSASNLDSLWDAAYARFVATDNGHPGLLGGILEGARDKRRDWVENKLDAVVGDPALSEQLITLHNAVPLDAAAVGRFSSALAQGVIAVDRFSQLMMGSVTKPLPGAVLARFLRELYTHEAGLEPALQILNMRFYGDRSDKVAIDPALIEVGREMLLNPRIYTHENHQQEHGISEIAELLFEANEDPELARAICVAMRDNAGDNYVSNREFGDLAVFLMKRYPRIVYDEIIDRSSNEYLLERFFGELADDDDDKVLKPDEGASTLLEWVAEDPRPRALKVAHIVRYTMKDVDSDKLRWSDLALALVDIAPDPAPVLLAFERRFFTGAGWGPFSLRFVRRRPLVSAMLQHPDPRAQAWAREAGARLEESILRWDEKDREGDSRFE